MTENKKIPASEIKEKIKDVKDALKSIRPDKALNDTQLERLLCRVGELELCLIFNKEIRNNPKAKLKINRLCTCYDKGSEE